MRLLPGLEQPPPAPITSAMIVRRGLLARLQRPALGAGTGIVLFDAVLV